MLKRLGEACLIKRGRRVRKEVMHMLAAVRMLHRLSTGKRGRNTTPGIGGAGWR